MDSKKNLEKYVGHDGLDDSETVVRISLEDKRMSAIIAKAYVDLLKRYNCNISALVRDLDIGRQSLYNKLRQYNIDLTKLRKEI